MSVRDIEVLRRGQVLIRAMRASEAPAVGALTLAAYDAYGTIGGDYRDYLGDPSLRLAGNSGLWVAEVDGTLAGTVTYAVPGDEAWEGRPEPEGDCAFRVLAVAPGFEGRGVGRALVDACIATARADGRHRMVISSMVWMARAHRLYEALGFERRPDLDVRFPGGVGVVFTLDLTPDAPERFAPPGRIPATPPWFEDVWA